jgi:hypothetical protein
MSAYRDKSQGFVFIFTDKDLTRREYSFRSGVEEYPAEKNTEMELYKLIENTMHLIDDDTHDIDLIIDELIEALRKL